MYKSNSKQVKIIARPARNKGGYYFVICSTILLLYPLYTIKIVIILLIEIAHGNPKAEPVFIIGGRVIREKNIIHHGFYYVVLVLPAQSLFFRYYGFLYHSFHSCPFTQNKGLYQNQALKIPRFHNSIIPKFFIKIKLIMPKGGGVYVLYIPFNYSIYFL